MRFFDPVNNCIIYFEQYLMEKKTYSAIYYWDHFGRALKMFSCFAILIFILKTWDIQQ